MAALSCHRVAIRDQVATQRASVGPTRISNGYAIPHRSPPGKDRGMGVGAQRCSQRPGIRDGHDYRDSLWPDGYIALRRRSLPARGALLSDLEKLGHSLETA